MKNYYFTFGTSHNLLDGTPMHNHWVRVIADNYGTARQMFVDQFTSLYSNAIDKWAFQYEEANMKKDLFSKGEYALIQ